MISLGSRIASVETSQVAYFYYQEGSTFLRTLEGKNYPVDYSLEKLEGLLDPDNFFRVNRQMMVGFTSISKIHIMSKSRIKLDVLPMFEEEVWVSSHKSPAFRIWLDK
jgi:DNA-binding LytR/AlgR family response regulator